MTRQALRCVLEMRVDVRMYYIRLISGDTDAIEVRDTEEALDYEREKKGIPKEDVEARGSALHMNASGS